MFFKRRKTAPDQNAHDLEKKIAELEQRINKLNGQHVEYHFHVKQVDIHNPVLKELSFQLDQLDISDLSGALNVGNNFGVNVERKKGKDQQAQPQSDHSEGIKINIKTSEEKR